MIPGAFFTRNPQADDDQIARGHDRHDLLVITQHVIGILRHRGLAQSWRLGQLKPNVRAVPGVGRLLRRRQAVGHPAFRQQPLALPLAIVQEQEAKPRF